MLLFINKLLIELIGKQIEMKIADANVVLRYLLNDNEELSDKAAKNVPDSNCLITFSFAERLTID